MYQYKGKCLFIIDAETVVLEIDLGFRKKYIDIFNIGDYELPKEENLLLMCKKKLSEMILNKKINITSTFNENYGDEDNREFLLDISSIDYADYFIVGEEMNWFIESLNEKE